MRVSVVIPVYNERGSIVEIVRRVVNTGIPNELIIVDDCSRDGTAEILRDIKDGWTDKNCNLVIDSHSRNLGKGAALRSGFQHVTGDVVIVQDADLEYDPKDYSRLLAPILDGRADAV